MLQQVILLNHNYFIFQALPQEVRDELNRDRVALEKVVKYHIATAPQTCDQLRNNEELGTLDSTKKIVIKEYASVSNCQKIGRIFLPKYGRKLQMALINVSSKIQY